jgi:hypothetical protein
MALNKCTPNSEAVGEPFEQAQEFKVPGILVGEVCSTTTERF